MFTLPNFCRVCLKYDKNLIDLAHIENEPNETLMSKLQLCVSEVEWTAFKPLLCHPCIKRLNIAYSFKKQCVQSAGVLKNYVELVKESQKKNESQNVKSDNSLAQGGAYMLLPNQKYVKILVGAQNQGNTNTGFQNVFLNLIPAATLAGTSETTPAEKGKDTNQNVFLNLNSTFQKFIPLATAEPPVKKRQQRESLLKTNLTVNELLTESKAEEMSVEIDPTSFLSLEHDASSSEDESKNDWDEVITKQKVDAKQVRANGTTTNGKDVTSTSTNFVPILPKDDLYSGGHFLSIAPNLSDLNCESCQKSFSSIRLLKQHFKLFHLGKSPFKCNFCYIEYLTRAEYETCLSRHKKDEDLDNNALTLKDFSLGNDALSISVVKSTPSDRNLQPNENGDYVCDVCKRVFNSPSGLLRHRVRKHNQKNRKKYFIKGMKNARCDICKRDFSTQSYMQLHRKLHLREEGGYKYKVQGRSKYKNLVEDQLEGKTKQLGKTVRSKIVSKELVESKESDSESGNETTRPVKKQKTQEDILESKLDGNSLSSNEDKKEENEDSDSSVGSESETNDKN